MSNHLKEQTSPYLLQHAENPVDWYPWCREAFDKARREDKPVFLSIGYSTCHWCHVMAHESFEDPEIAEILNAHFVSVKVDREERPDIDSVYMAVCQAFTGSGGWPTTIFMTADQKPFFAGTYFPKAARYGSIGLREMLLHIHQAWINDRDALLQSANGVSAALEGASAAPAPADARLLDRAADFFRQSYDGRYGGFGRAPKFPTPHNLLFLMQRYQKHGDREALDMAETTLLQMYRGGLFDHIGYGFCRYSTDRRFLVPHFEKMLYDNALMIIALCRAYEITQKPVYRDIAQKTAFYVMEEMTSPDGGFYSAQDADSDGEEGGFYLLRPEEILHVLGETDGASFNRHCGITPEGNFEGRSIPNLLHAESLETPMDALLPAVRRYRLARSRLHTDDKILAFWNALMIAALAMLYRISRCADYLGAAQAAQQFIEARLCRDNTLFVSERIGRRGERGFLDDYAGYAYALLALRDATLDSSYLDRTERMVNRAIDDFYDDAHGGFYLYGREHESLILRPKETYDGAIPSGNALMAAVLVRLQTLRPTARTQAVLEAQLRFLSGEAAAYPAGHAMFLTALSDHLEPPPLITAVPKTAADLRELPFLVPSDWVIQPLDGPTAAYPLKNDEAAFYVCKGRRCLPPVTAAALPDLLREG